jgi:Zn-dependent protease
MAQWGKVLTLTPTAFKENRKMRTSITFGHAAGIPLKIHLNWFLTAGLVAWSLAAGYFPFHRPGWETNQYWAVGVITALFFFGSVLLHELGHSLVALREGVPVNSITLFIFGGVAHIGNEPETAGAEFRIVAAGPLTSLALAAVFFLVGQVGWLGPYFSPAAVYLAQMNVVLAVFNLLPGFPLDGGRLLRSAIWKWLDDYRRATRLATTTGVGMALIFVAGGIALMVWGDLFSGGWVAFVGWYLGTAAKDGYRQVELHEVDSNGLSLHEQGWSGGYSKQTLPRSPALRSTLFETVVVDRSQKRYLMTTRVDSCKVRTSDRPDW